MTSTNGSFIDEPAIFHTLELAGTADAAAVRAVLAKARELHGLEAAEIAVLMNVSDPALLGELFAAAQFVPGRAAQPFSKSSTCSSLRTAMRAPGGTITKSSSHGPLKSLPSSDIVPLRTSKVHPFAAASARPASMREVSSVMPMVRYR